MSKKKAVLNDKKTKVGVDYSSGVIGPLTDVGDILIWNGLSQHDAYNEAKNRTLAGKEKGKEKTKKQTLRSTANKAVADSNPALADSSTYSGGYSTDGYETTSGGSSFDRLRQQYQNDMNSLYNTRVNYLAGVRDRAIGDARTKYAGLANNAYVAYRQNMAKRRSMASNLGMTGGAVENMRVGDENNYSNSLANVNSGRNTAYTNARNAYSDAENNARVNRDTAIANNQAELSQAEIAYNQNQAQADRLYAAQQAQWETENNQWLKEYERGVKESEKNRQAQLEAAKTIALLNSKVTKLQNALNKSKGR